MALAEEERCATCGSGDPRQGTWRGAECGDPYHAATWHDDDLATDDAAEEVTLPAAPRHHPGNWWEAPEYTKHRAGPYPT
jgi:hypothetical protein